MYIYGVTCKGFISKPHTSCTNMCSGSWSSKIKHPASPVAIRQQQQQQQQQKKKTKKISHVSMTLRRKRLRLRRMRRDGAEMELLNLKLYLENRCILAENERLRERACALCLENLALRANLCKTVPALAGAETAGHGC